MPSHAWVVIDDGDEQRREAPPAGDGAEDVVIRPLVVFEVSLERGRRVRSRDVAEMQQVLVSALMNLGDAVVTLDGAPGARGVEWAYDVDPHRYSVRGRLDRDGLAARICDVAGDCSELTTQGTPAEQAEAVRARVQDWARVEATSAGPPTNPMSDPRVALRLAVEPCLRGGTDLACIEGLPQKLRATHQVLRLLVDAAEPGTDTRVDALIAWANASPSPESAAEARTSAVESGRYAEARAMDDLERRRGGRGGGLALRRALDHSQGDEIELPSASRSVRTAAEARQALDAGEPRQALALSESLLKTEPWHPDGWAVKTRALAELGRTADAQAALNTLERVDPLSGEATMVRRLLGGGE